MAVNNYISQYMPDDLPWYESDVLIIVHGSGAQNWGDGAHSRSLSFVNIS